MVKTHIIIAMKNVIVIAIASLPFVFGGCTTSRLPDYQPASPPDSERTVQKSGVEIAVDPFVEYDRTKKYFDLDAAEEGIAILHVRVTNKASDQTFLVEKENFQLLPDGSAGSAVDSKNMQLTNVAGGIVSAIGAGGLLGLLEAASVSQSSEIQRNYTSKEMPDATLSPGKSIEGFIYFAPVAKGTNWARTADVKINLTETKSRQIISLNVPLSH
jgi:hypothetical protein